MTTDAPTPGPTLAPRLAELAAAPATESAPKRAPDPTPVLEQFTFYHSPSHRATYAPGRSISLFKGQEFTEACRVGQQPAKRSDLMKVGTGTMADVTTVKPA